MCACTPMIHTQAGVSMQPLILTYRVGRIRCHYCVGGKGRLPAIFKICISISSRAQIVIDYIAVPCKSLKRNKTGRWI